MSQPVKRGPGRPRKQPIPEYVPVTVVSEAVAEVTPEVVPDVPVDESDPRIGQSCDAAWSGVGFDDGCSYRCEDGVVVERVT